MVKLYSPLTALILVFGLAASSRLPAQVESAESSSPSGFTWISHGRIEGHLAVNYSPAAAFSPESSTLAVASEDKVVLMGLGDRTAMKFQRPRIQGLTELQIQSANFLSPTRLLLLGTGVIPAQKKGDATVTPLLAFQWNIQDDTLYGKVNAVNMKEGGGRPRYLPHISFLGMYRDSTFELWNPGSDRKTWLALPSLTRVPNVFEISPAGKWLLLAQIEGNSSADPIVVRALDGQFVDTLRDHRGTVLSMSFSRDSTKVVTTCEDGNVRVYSAPDWKLLATLSGHEGPVHWAEFSPDGHWIASAGEDRTVRIWSSAEGKLEQTLSESQAPVLTVAFSPNGEYVAASSEQTVFVWQRVRGN